MKSLFHLFILIISISSYSQVTFKSLEPDLIQFLIKNGDIHKLELEDYLNGKRGVRIAGNEREYRDEQIMDGIYSFSQARTHARAYFMIIENGEKQILNITSRSGLETAIKDILDFSEKKNIVMRLLIITSLV